MVAFRFYFIVVVDHRCGHLAGLEKYICLVFMPAFVKSSCKVFVESLGIWEFGSPTGPYILLLSFRFALGHLVLHR
jgi:hypothetical protein